MKRFNLIAPFLLGASLTVHASLDFLVDGVLVPMPQSNTQSCISYTPSMGEVKEAEDLKINSDRFQFTDDKSVILVNPLLIIEVLSPSTEGYDRGRKFQDYRDIVEHRPTPFVSGFPALLVPAFSAQCRSNRAFRLPG